jgi:NAD dependent epimerase/dehydratase family enzyme
VLHRPAVAPVPAFAIKLLYGEMSEIVTKGQNVVPRELQRNGYEFRRPELEDSLRKAVSKG